MGLDLEHPLCQAVDQGCVAVPKQFLDERALQPVVLIEALPCVRPERRPGTVDQVRLAIQSSLDPYQGVLELAGCREVVVAEFSATRNSVSNLRDQDRLNRGQVPTDRGDESVSGRHMIVRAKGIPVGEQSLVQPLFQRVLRRFGCYHERI